MYTPTHETGASSLAATHALRGWEPAGGFVAAAGGERQRQRCGVRAEAWARRRAASGWREGASDQAGWEGARRRAVTRAGAQAGSQAVQEGAQAGRQAVQCSAGGRTGRQAGSAVQCRRAHRQAGRQCSAVQEGAQAGRQAVQCSAGGRTGRQAGSAVQCRRAHRQAGRQCSAVQEGGAHQLEFLDHAQLCVQLQHHARAAHAPPARVALHALDGHHACVARTHHVPRARTTSAAVHSTSALVHSHGNRLGCAAFCSRAPRTCVLRRQRAVHHRQAVHVLGRVPARHQPPHQPPPTATVTSTRTTHQGGPHAVQRKQPPSSRTQHHAFSKRREQLPWRAACMVRSPLLCLLT